MLFFNGTSEYWFDVSLSENPQLIFVYHKDDSTSEGDDTCWVDDIRWEYCCLQSSVSCLPSKNLYFIIF